MFPDYYLDDDDRPEADPDYLRDLEIDHHWDD